MPKIGGGVSPTRVLRGISYARCDGRELLGYTDSTLPGKAARPG